MQMKARSTRRTQAPNRRGQQVVIRESIALRLRKGCVRHFACRCRSQRAT